MKPSELLINCGGDKLSSGIYMILCSGNGKAYVGQTNKIRNRFNRHKCELRRQVHDNPLLQACHNKYGEASLCYLVLENCPITALNNRERFYVSLIDESLRLNLNSIEDIPRSKEFRNILKGKPLSEEHREKLSQAAKRRWANGISQEKHEQLKKAAKRAGEVKRGVPLPVETREKLSNSLKERYAKFGVPTMAPKSRIKISESLKRYHAARKMLKDQDGLLLSLSA